MSGRPSYYLEMPGGCPPIDPSWFDVGEEGIRQIHDMARREQVALEANPDATVYDAMPESVQRQVDRLRGSPAIAAIVDRRLDEWYC